MFHRNVFFIFWKSKHCLHTGSMGSSTSDIDISNVLSPDVLHSGSIAFSLNRAKMSTGLSSSSSELNDRVLNFHGDFYAHIRFILKFNMQYSYTHVRTDQLYQIIINFKPTNFSSWQCIQIGLMMNIFVKLKRKSLTKWGKHWWSEMFEMANLGSTFTPSDVHVYMGRICMQIYKS